MLTSKRKKKETSKKQQHSRRCCHGSCVATRDLVAGRVAAIFTRSADIIFEGCFDTVVSHDFNSSGVELCKYLGLSEYTKCLPLFPQYV